ncbi:MAG: PQQ-binding-like beta-propeller repeat protein [Hahellaceae bacterium]|nr:PQQ-binding-like beta-propeller repeat protein [Hahellaceae bacterium]
MNVDWTKSFFNVGRASSVQFGGIPCCKENICSEISIDIALICEGGVLHFFDLNAAEYCQWDVASQEYIARKNIDVYGATMLLYADGIVFLGDQALDRNSVEVKFDLTKVFEGNKYERRGRMFYWGDSELSTDGDACYLNNKIYRIIDCNDVSKGLIEIDTQTWQFDRVDYPFLTIEPGVDGLIIGNTEHEIGAFKLGEGIQWKYEVEKDSNYSMEHGLSFALFDDRIIITTRQGDIICLNQSDGSLIWQSSISELINYDWVSNPSRLSAPTINGKVAIIENFLERKVVFTVDLTDGRLLWTRDINLINGCIAGDLFFTSEKSKDTPPIALDCYTGEIVWQADEPFEDAYQVIASGKYVIYLSTYFNGYVFEWETPYISPHRPA